MHRGVEEWLPEISSTSKFLDKILSMTHPALYHAASIAHAQLAEDPTTQIYMSEWPSLFTGVSPVTNRTSPRHRDHFGSIKWYDQLVTLGTYKSATLKLDELGASFAYCPGTIVHLC